MNNEELNDKVARLRGWIDYPTDSIEAGRYWHLDKNTAPFGERMPKYEWNPCGDAAQAYFLASMYGMWVYFGDKNSSVDFMGTLVEQEHPSGESGNVVPRLVCQALVTKLGKAV